jgi:hypothetical protein
MHARPELRHFLPEFPEFHDRERSKKVPLLVLCCGGDFATNSTARSICPVYLPKTGQSACRSIAAEPSVHVEDVLLGDAEPPGDELDLVGAQVAVRKIPTLNSISRGKLSKIKLCPTMKKRKH